MSTLDPHQGVSKPDFFSSSEVLGHVTPKLGYLAKSENVESVFSDRE